MYVRSNRWVINKKVRLAGNPKRAPVALAQVAPRRGHTSWISKRTPLVFYASAASRDINTLPPPLPPLRRDATRQNEKFINKPRLSISSNHELALNHSTWQHIPYLEAYPLYVWPACDSGATPAAVRGTFPASWSAPPHLVRSHSRHHWVPPAALFAATIAGCSASSVTRALTRWDASADRRSGSAGADPEDYRRLDPWSHNQY